MLKDIESQKHQKKESFVNAQTELQRLRHEKWLEMQREKELKVQEIKMQKEQAA